MSDLPASTQPPVTLRIALVGAIRRRRSRIRFRTSAAAVTAAALVAVLFGGGVFTGGPERVLAIDDGNEWVTVRILDGEAGAAEMTQELQDAGIDGEVRLVPAVPEFVGQWMGIAQVDPLPPPHCDLPEDAPPDVICVNPPLLSGSDAGFNGEVFQIRRDAIGQLAEVRTIFYVGREPEPGEMPLDRPPDDYTVRVMKVQGSGSWLQSVGPGRRPSD